MKASEIFNAMNLVFETTNAHLRWELMMNGHRPTALLRILPDYKQAAPHPRQVPAAAGRTSPVNYLTDEQLLALFTNTPVGLAKVGDKTILIFPRAGDKERFIGRF